MTKQVEAGRYYDFDVEAKRGPGVWIVFDPDGPHQDRPHVCLQCVNVEPVPIEQGSWKQGAWKQGAWMPPPTRTQ